MPVLGKWGIVSVLAVAQFVLVLDSTVMNVSIDEVVNDLDTTVDGMQLAITTYTLTMAVFMLIGGKLGDVFGRRRAFRIGTVIYAVGAGITAAAPNINILMLGWSIIEGLGAVLIIPAAMALIAGNYRGRDRAMAYSIIGAVGGAGSAAGPIIGGYVSTELSWRVVFGVEVFIMLGALLASVKIPDVEGESARSTLDKVGAALSAFGMGLVVLALVKSTTWGWIEPNDPPTIDGTAITPFGLSPVPLMVGIGIALLGLFAFWEERMAKHGGQPLLRIDLLRIPRLRAGLLTLLSQYFIIAGTFFVLPLFLQIVLGKDPLETGIKILPLSIGVLVASMFGTKLATRFAPKRIAQVGIGLLSAGALTLYSTISLSLDAPVFLTAMIVMGSGLGLLISQLGNINMSSVGEERSSEVGGLQGVAQYLGSSLGTAVIGAILLTGLTSAFNDNLTNNKDLSSEAKANVSRQTSQGLEFIPTDQAKKIVEQHGATQQQADDLADSYSDAQLEALRKALLAVAALGLFVFVFTRRLPTERIGPAP